MRLSLPVLILLSACAPGSPNEVRISAEQIRILSFHENYQQVYRRLVSSSRDCFETGLITASMQVHSELYTDIDRGEVSYELVGALGKEVYAVADIIGEDGGTRVEIRTAPGFTNFSDEVEKYARGEGC